MPYDKKLHLACGFAICLASCLTIAKHALLITIIAGALKELYDYYNQDKHTVEFADFAYTVCGGAIAQAIYNIVCIFANI